jgi:AhpD family alkylhydroperoxidase
MTGTTTYDADTAAEADRARLERIRVPLAPLRGPFARLLVAWSRRVYGDVLDGVRVLLHHPQVLRADIAWEKRIERWDELDPELKTLAQLASAGLIGCSWCLDFGAFVGHREGLDLAKLREVPRWRDSAAFDERERAVLAYAEAMTVTPPAVTDEMVSSLVADLGVAAVVELTMMVAVENQRSRFNSAMGLTSQGFSDRCELTT